MIANLSSVLKSGIAAFGLVAIGLAAAAGSAQTVRGDDKSTPNVGLNLPSIGATTPQRGPKIYKATAIVNGDVITATDIEQRLAMIVMFSGGRVKDEEKGRLRTQLLSNIIDESLQIQAAKAQEITVSNKELDQQFAEIARKQKKTPQQFAELLKANGSSVRSLRRQVEGEMAWSRLVGRRIASRINVSEDEAKAMRDRILGEKGTIKYHPAEIFLSATPDNSGQVAQNMQRIVEGIKNGGSFEAYAKQFSEATTSIVGGDLGWLRPSQLPSELSKILTTMKIGEIAGPIPVQGGYSLLYLLDTQQVLAADPRDSKFSLRQMVLNFPAGSTPETAKPIVESFRAAVAAMKGCGDVAAVAKKFNAEVKDNDAIVIRDLPDPRLQNALLELQVGQSLPIGGSLKDGVSTLTICGRDAPQVTDAPSIEDLGEKARQERVQRRAQVFLRDLRRDAVIEYR